MGDRNDAHKALDYTPDSHWRSQLPPAFRTRTSHKPDSSVDRVSVQFLGSGDAFGSGGRLQTCIHVESAASNFLIDCGASALIGLRRWKVNPNAVDAILLTHLHGDHFGGLPFFLLDAQLVSKRTRPLTIVGPAGAPARIRDAQEVLFPGSSHAEPTFPVRYLEWVDTSPLQVAGVDVTPYTMVHASGAAAYALRIKCGARVIAYSGDTEWTDALIRAAQGADLFICEAYFWAKQIKYHLDYRTVKANLARLGCKRMMLTHMNEDLLARLHEVDLEWAEDGKRILL